MSIDREQTFAPVGSTRTERPAVRTVAELMVRYGVARPAPAPADAARLQGLIDAGAWTEVALTVLKIALPQWRLKRLVLDDGEWHCALSRHVDYPDWLDDAVETRHEILPLAILSAVADVARTTRGPNLRSVPITRLKPHQDSDPICCDNFG